MGDYISRQAVLAKQYESEGTCGLSTMVVDVRDIEDAPAADVVPVVRCKDCVDAPNGDEGDGYAYCHRFCEVVPPAHFCGYGTRKEATT